APCREDRPQRSLIPVGLRWVNRHGVRGRISYVQTRVRWAEGERPRIRKSGLISNEFPHGGLITRLGRRRKYENSTPHIVLRRRDVDRASCVHREATQAA